MEDGGGGDSSDNELSIMTKAELYYLIISPISVMMTMKALLMRLLQQFTYNGAAV